MPVFTANIPNALRIGDRIEIGGKIKDDARKMSVNLCAQEGEEPKDVVLHFDVRFHRDNIISLSRKNGVWIGSGNYDTNYNMFVPGTIFRIIFEIKDTDVVTIYCQGKFHSNFLPKIPLGMARFLVVWADIERITHCYFHSCQEGGEVPQLDPNSTIGPLINVEKKRNTQNREKRNMRRPSNESLGNNAINTKNKSQSRADRYFYDTLMCQPDPSKFKKEKQATRPKQNCNESVTEETESKNMETESGTESEVMPDIKKRDRRGRFGSLGHVVNFINRGTARRS